jgi:putative tryptophan/tyrosine transport system substrate-binding protein
MRRRDLLIVATGGLALGFRPYSSLSQPFRVWKMGFLAHGNEIFYQPLFDRLKELGYEEGRNLIVERRYAEGHADRFQQLAKELVQQNVDIIIVVTTPAALAAKNATTTIPIVFPNAINPVETGVVASLGHPGFNVTGGAIPTAELSAKRLELLKEMMPDLSQGMVLWNEANPSVSLGWRDTQNAGRALRIVLDPQRVREPADFGPAFAMLAQKRPQVIIVFQDALTLQHRDEIIDFTVRERLPAMFTAKEWTDAGGLVSYGENLSEMYRRGAYFVDRILRGANPMDLPVEQPTKYDLMLNMKTAKAIGLTIPHRFLDRVDNIIE